MAHVIEIPPQIRTRQVMTILDPKKELREIIDADMGSDVADLYNEIICELEEDDYGDNYEAIADSLRNFLVDCMNELQEIVMQKRLNRDKLLNLYKKMNREL